MFERIKNLFSAEDRSIEEEINIPAIVDQIRQRESKENIPLGRRIHTLHHGDLDLFLDRDITENYRITVNRGGERIYSFSIYADQGNYDILEEGYEKIIGFLDGGSKVSELPDNAKIKGFFYGD